MTRQDGRKPGLGSPFLDAPLVAEAEDAGRNLWPMRIETPYLGASILRRDGASSEPYIGGETDAAALTQDEKGIIGRRDARTRVGDTRSVPFRWICSVAVQRRITYLGGRETKTGLAPAGTGVLISPRHVLTAAHVLRSVKKDASATEWHEAQFVAVTPAWDGSSPPPFGEIEAASWKLHPSWDPDRGDSRFDYAVITLKQAIGDRVFESLNGQRLGFWGSPRDGAGSLDSLPSALLANLIGARVVTAGYPQEAHGEMWCSAGQLSSESTRILGVSTRDGRAEQWARGPQTISVTADATEGQSGSPVWIVDRGHRYLVGILVTAGDDANEVVLLNTNAMRQIQAWIGTAQAAGQTRELVDEPSPRGEAAPAEAASDAAELLGEVDKTDEVDETDETDAHDEVDETDAHDEVDEADAHEHRDAGAELETETEADLEEESWQDYADDDETSVGFEQDAPRSAAEVSVGQRIVLDLNTTTFAGSIAAVTWAIPGIAVRGYTGTTKSVKLTKLTKDDRQQRKIAFFWVDAGDGRTVRAKIRTTSGTDQEFTAVFDVKRPTLVTFTGEPDRTRFEKRHGERGMRLGKLIDAPGIQWSWKVTMPPHQAGQIKDLQTILLDREQILALSPGSAKTRTLVSRHPSKPTPHVQFDGEVDGGAAYTPGLLDLHIGAGESYAIHKKISDSPFMGLPSLARRVKVNDRFTYYLLFKPDMANPDDAIWVPVAKATWFWKAKARPRDKEWDVVSEDRMRTVRGAVTTDFPLYDTNVSENEWQEVSP